jgi:hypothetical protein
VADATSKTGGPPQARKGCQPPLAGMLGGGCLRGIFRVLTLVWVNSAGAPARFIISELEIHTLLRVATRPDVRNRTDA